MNRKEDLTAEGLQEIINIKASINNGLSDTLQEAFPNTKPVPRPVVHSPAIIDPNWLAGFVDGDGCFQVEISKSSTLKQGKQVRLTFLISQHIRDAQLMERLNSLLGCGKYSNFS